MKEIFKNNVFTNPRGWAEKSVGTPFRYRFTQIGIVVVAILFYTMLVLKSESFKIDDYIWFGLMVFGCVEILLICFMVIRHLLKEIAKFEQ
jgi:hypothetical protein